MTASTQHLDNSSFTDSVGRAFDWMRPCRGVGFKAVAIGGVLAAQTAASAAFVNLHLVQHSVNGGSLMPVSTTWRLYAEFDSPTDQLTRVHGDWPQFSLCLSGPGFYQNQFAGPTSRENNEAFWAFLPSMYYDSYVTIGGEGASESNTLTHTGISFSSFESGGPLVFINGEWARPLNDPYAFGEVLPGLPNWHVLVAQFTVYGTGTATAPMGVLNLSGYRDWFGVNGDETVPWTLEGVPFGSPPSEPGACCIEDPNYGLICQLVAEEYCADLGGYWYGPGTVCSDPFVECEPMAGEGACCYHTDDGALVCSEMIEEYCVDLGGYWYGPGSTCSDPFVECDPLNEEGACCYQDPDFGLVCSVMIEEYCVDLGGYWYGPGTICSDPFVECDPLPEAGACCYEDPKLGLVCDVMLESKCDDLGGYWYGPGSVCTDPFVECDPIPETGACCIEEEPGSGYWYCVEISEFDCLDHLGVWYGLGSQCTDPGVNCDPIEPCEAVPGSDCAGRPQYDDQDYLAFGNGRVAVQTVSPSIPGNRVLTVFDLTGIGSAPFNTDFPIGRYSHPSWTEASLGSILGLAIDEEGNIFVTATQTWNNDVVGPSGWGAVYRIDAYSAAISTFAVLPTSNSSLGSITYDCDHGQFFVTSFEDGLIYRLDHATGAVLDTFDHGTPWSGNPGPVALGDRPFAVEVNGDRLFYSLWNEDYNNPSASASNEIWSVKLDAAGMPVAGSEVLEITVPDYSMIGNAYFSSPTADIDFSPSGTLVLGERSQIGIQNTAAHQARVLEYECTSSGWTLTSHVFHVGQIAESASGGVDANESRVWASGDGMHIGAGDNIYGFQGLPAVGGSILDSWLIDYNGDLSVQDKTLLGDLVVTRTYVAPPTADCPIVQELGVDCLSNSPPYDFELHFGVSNMDAVETITSVSMTPPSGMSLTPDHVTLALPPLHSWPFDTVLSGASGDTTICIDFEITFSNGAVCIDTLCIELPGCGVPGDVDMDGDCDIDDLLALLAAWGTNDPNADLNGDGIVNIDDLLILLSNI